jgi:hypothetical protein
MELNKSSTRSDRLVKSSEPKLLFNNNTSNNNNNTNNNDSLKQSEVKLQPNDNINKIVMLFLFLQNTMKIYHWNTKKYPRHKASDEFIERFSSNVDKFVEVFMGRHNTTLSINNIEIGQQINDNNVFELLERCRKSLEDFTCCIKDTDLLNIRDEMLSDINQTIYLFRLT